MEFTGLVTGTQYTVRVFTLSGGPSIVKTEDKFYTLAEWSADSSTRSSCSDSEITTRDGDSKVTTTDVDSEVTTKDGDSKVTRDSVSKVPTTNGDSKSLPNDNRKELSMLEKPMNANCGVQFDENDELTTHNITRNLCWEIPFKCGICGSCFAKPEELRAHLLSHTLKETLQV